MLVGVTAAGMKENMEFMAGFHTLDSGLKER